MYFLVKWSVYKKECNSWWWCAGQSFWVDRPAKKLRTDSDELIADVNTSSQNRESEAEVPLYDRVIPSLATPETRNDG